MFKSNSRNNKTLKLPWTGEWDREHYVIRDSNNLIIAVVPDTTKEQGQVGSFIINSANFKPVRENVIDKIENIAMVFGMSILILVSLSILVDIAYAPMLILGGGILAATSYIYLTRTQNKL